VKHYILRSIYSLIVFGKGRIAATVWGDIVPIYKKGDKTD
jgi:hypothetical protein